MKKQKPERTIADDIFGFSTRKSGRAAREKGVRGELMACALLTDWTGAKFSRVPASGGLKWKADNRVTGDVVPPLSFEFPFSIEIKNYEDLRMDDIRHVKKGMIRKFWLQAETDAFTIKKIPLLLVKDNKSKFALIIHGMYSLPGCAQLFNLQYPKYGLELKAFDFVSVTRNLNYVDFRTSLVK